MNIPADLRYTKDHEWAKIDGDIATVGITDYAQGELGDIVFVELPQPGDTFDEGDAFGTIEAVKAVSDMYMPLNGEITEINGVLEDEPETVNNSPYEDGWMIKIKMSDPSQADNLLSADQYNEIIGEG